MKRGDYFQFVSRFAVPLLFSSLLLFSCLPSSQQPSGNINLEEILEVESKQASTGKAGLPSTSQEISQLFVTTNTQRCALTYKNRENGDEAVGVRAQVRVRNGWQMNTYFNGCDKQGKLREYTCISRREAGRNGINLAYRTSSCSAGQSCSQGEISCKMDVPQTVPVVPVVPIVPVQPPSSTSPAQTSRQSPEIPSEAERATLPDCAGKKFTEFTVFPVDLSKVTEIAPLGSVNPPGHTFPTEHTYLHFQAGGFSTETYPLSSPADVFITSISKGTGFTQDPEDYTIYFALCKEIIGYYNHVKELSPELQNIFTTTNSAGKCKQNPGNTQYTYCENVLNPVKEGILIGQVGRLQGNFDFGLIDLRKTLAYIDPSRYGVRSLHIQCPYEYYPAAMKEKFFEKIARNDPSQCGMVAQDLADTLQGNWFYATAKADVGTDWTQYLAFVMDNFNPEQQVISIGGVFTNAGKWYFTPQSSGVINRRFDKVKADGKIYCYESSAQQGRILVQLISSTQLKIEKQSGSCSPEGYSFNNEKKYER